jgi:4-hydroxyphenylpyruvate dioxygenase
MTTPTAQPAATHQPDPMPLLGIDHVEMWVGNAAQAAFHLERAFGFTEVAYAGLETGLRDRASRVVTSGRVRFCLTGTLRSDTPIADHHRRHGDGVKVIALSVPDVDVAFAAALDRGARSVTLPHSIEDDHGTARIAEIETYGETVHRFVDRSGYDGPFLPGFKAVEHEDRHAHEPMLLTIDHIVGNVELGRMEEWVHYYERVFGMTELVHFSDEAISTEYSALMSKVVEGGHGRIKFPINEPAEGRRKSQIDEYLDFYEGPGAQHIALTTRDIIGTVAELSARGVKFLRTPEAYYDELPGRIGDIDEELADLRRLGILADRDDEGYLLQIFTKPLGDRPTIFFEIIERHGARGFGEGNFKALFEAIEREQAARGNL